MTTTVLCRKCGKPMARTIDGAVYVHSVDRLEQANPFARSDLGLEMLGELPIEVTCGKHTATLTADALRVGRTTRI
jgi:hypothetical protein